MFSMVIHSDYIVSILSKLWLAIKTERVESSVKIVKGSLHW